MLDLKNGAEFVGRVGSVGEGTRNVGDLQGVQREALESFRTDVRNAAVVLYSKVPEEKADPILNNFFKALVLSDSKLFFKRMDESHCLPENLQNLSPNERTHLYLFRRQVLDAAAKVYAVTPEQGADVALKAFFEDLVAGAPPV